MRAFDVKFSARYSRPGQWYAPLFYFKRRGDDEPIAFDDAVVMITNPLNLKAFIDNWWSLGIELGDYETALLLNDTEFDEFMRWNEENGRISIVDPIFDPENGALVSGYPIRSIENITESTFDT